MKTYSIEIFVPDYLINNWERDLVWAKEYGDDKEEIAGIKEFLNKLYKWRSTPVEVSSLEEYFALIEEISDACDGEYRVCNGGHGVVVGE